LKIFNFLKVTKEEKEKRTEEEYFSTGKDENKLAHPIAFYPNTIYIKITPLACKTDLIKKFATKIRMKQKIIFFMTIYFKD
jgi:hypothetical protein